MATKPTTPVPTWATDTNYTTGYDIGLSTKVEPTTGEKAEGHFRGKRPPARKINWLTHWICQWLGWAEDELDEVNVDVSTHSAQIGALTTHINLVEDMVEDLEDQQSYFAVYAVASVDNELRVDSIAAVDVKGNCFRIGNVATTVGVHVEFRVPYEPNAAGEKSFDLPLPAGATWTPDANFGSEFSAFGHGTANSGDVRSPVQIFAVPSTKTVRVSWDDAVSSTTAGTSFVRGSFSYAFAP